jgi:hypothetical protein
MQSAKDVIESVGNRRMIWQLDEQVVQRPPVFV